SWQKFFDRKSLDCMALQLLLCPTEIRALRLVFGRDYRKLGELGLSECLIEGPKLIEITNEKVVVAKEKLKEARSQQKSYADKHRRDLEFQVGDRIFLKVSPF
nr:putative nucleotidyltransferase, ribonuclease H [Tanacetum cinerariifolium]